MADDGLAGFAQRELDRKVAEWVTENAPIVVRLHTDAPNDRPEGAVWGSVEAGSTTITHWSAWDAPCDRPRRLVGRPLRWLGAALTDLGTRRARPVAFGPMEVGSDG